MVTFSIIFAVVVEYTTNVDHLAAILGIAAFVHVDDVLIDKLKVWRRKKHQHPVAPPAHHHRHHHR